MADLQRLEAIANSMLKVGEKIEAKVGGNYSDDNRPGNNEIVKGFMAATNHRLLMVLNSGSRRIRKDSFAYEQVATVTMHDHLINIVLPDETITLFDIIDDRGDLKKLHKYVAEKKARPPKSTITARDVEIIPPPLKMPSKALIKKIELVEAKRKGMVVAIDSASGNYFLGKDTIAAVERGRKKLPEAAFYCIRIGYPGVDEHKGGFHKL